jgi:hypothetical protein
MAFLAVAADGFKILKPFKIEPRNQESAGPLSRIISQSSPFQNCLSAFVSGSQDVPSPLCKAWALDFIRSRHNFEDARMDPSSNNEENYLSRNIQDLRVSQAPQSFQYSNRISIIA